MQVIDLTFYHGIIFRFASIGNTEVSKVSWTHL